VSPPGSHSQIDEAKRRLRVELAERCARVEIDAADRAGRAALSALEHDARFRAAASIAAFAATAGEPVTRPLVEAVLDRGGCMLMPRCTSASAMELAPIAAWDDLQPGRYGLREPTAPAWTGAWRSGDLVLVPGLAFDERGGRLGRGAGYYDRFFGDAAHGMPWLVGFGFSFQLVDEVPMDVHDRHLDGVLTEAGLVWRAGAR